MLGRLHCVHHDILYSLINMELMTKIIRKIWEISSFIPLKRYLNYITVLSQSIESEARVQNFLIS